MAIAAGVITELVVLGNLSGDLAWAKPVVIAVGGVCAVVLAVKLSGRVRLAVLMVALAALLAAPATWAAETIGHATSSTFPAGGPASAGGFGGFGGPGGGPGGRGSRLRGSFPGGGAAGPGGGFAGPPGSAGAPAGTAGGSASSSAANIQSLFGSTGASRSGAFPRGGFGGRGGPGGGGGMFGGNSTSLTAASNYAKAHGGGTVGVESQASAAEAILTSNANVAGLGGFSGRESSVTASWLAMEVKDGRLRWILSESGTQGFGGMPGDSRQGSTAAIAIAEKVGRKVTFTSGGTRITMYDLRGKAAAILAAADQG